jgi:hypothetical protein
VKTKVTEGYTGSNKLPQRTGHMCKNFIKIGLKGDVGVLFVGGGGSPTLFLFPVESSGHVHEIHVWG